MMQFKAKTVKYCVELIKFHEAPKMFVFRVHFRGIEYFIGVGDEVAEMIILVNV